MKLQWTKGQRGHADRTTECGRYEVVLSSLGDRHTNSASWAGCLSRTDGAGYTIFLGADGRAHTRGLDIPEHTMRDAKAACQLHADAQAPPSVSDVAP